MTAYFALIPAAGSGSRMGSALPKQYQALAGKPLVHYAISRLCSHPSIRQVFVVLAADDINFKSYDWSAFESKLVPVYCGGATRSASVFNGLVAAHDVVDTDDWMLVHDAARPCLEQSALDRLITELSNDDVGGLLATPVADTLKRASGRQSAVATVPRTDLWQAQTPQMFRYRMLFEALRMADPQVVTDEASAVERLGLKPRLVMGSPGNIKITYPEDLLFAEKLLKA